MEPIMGGKERQVSFSGLKLTQFERPLKKNKTGHLGGSVS